MRTLQFAGAAWLLAICGSSPSFAQGSGAAPAAAPAPAPAAEPDPRNLALATEIIDLSYPPAVRHALVLRRVNALIEQIEAAARQQVGELNEPGALAIYERYMARIRAEVDRQLAIRSPLTFAAYARAYARKFSYDELVEIRAFVRTPTGARFLERASDVYSDPDVARVTRESLGVYTAALEPIAQAFEREMRDYVANHGRAQPRRR